MPPTRTSRNSFAMARSLRRDRLNRSQGISKKFLRSPRRAWSGPEEVERGAGNRQLRLPIERRVAADAGKAGPKRLRLFVVDQHERRVPALLQNRNGRVELPRVDEVPPHGEAFGVKPRAAAVERREHHRLR